MPDDTTARAEYQAKALAALEKLKTQLDERRVEAELAQAEARERPDAAHRRAPQATDRRQVRLDDVQLAGADARRVGRPSRWSRWSTISATCSSSSQVRRRTRGGRGSCRRQGSVMPPLRVEERRAGTEREQRLGERPGPARTRRTNGQPASPGTPRRREPGRGRRGSCAAGALGVWAIPDAEVGALGDVRVLDVLELGARGAQRSIALGGDPGRIVGIDESGVSSATWRATWWPPWCVPARARAASGSRSVTAVRSRVRRRRRALVLRSRSDRPEWHACPRERTSLSQPRDAAGLLATTRHGSTARPAVPARPRRRDVRLGEGTIHFHRHRRRLDPSLPPLGLVVDDLIELSPRRRARPTYDLVRVEGAGAGPPRRSGRCAGRAGSRP